MVNKLKFQISGPRSFSVWAKHGFALQLRYSKPSLKNRFGERQKAYIRCFCSLECSNRRRVGGGGLEQNLIFCLPGLIQGCRTQGESKILSFWF